MKKGIVLCLVFILIYSLLNENNHTNKKREPTIKEKVSLLSQSKSEDEIKVEEKQTCADCISYLKIEGFIEDFWVVQGSDNQYYLNHNKEQKIDAYGAVFLDYRNSIEDKVLYLYGHNMSDGRMFTPLLNYDKEDYLMKYQKLWFIDEEWIILKGIKIGEQSDDLFALGFNEIINDEHYDKYLVYLENLFQCLLPIERTDQLLILSTCFEMESSERFIVLAKKVERGK